MLDKEKAIKVKRNRIIKWAKAYADLRIHKAPTEHPEKLLTLDPKKHYSYTINDELYIKKEEGPEAKVIIGIISIAIGIILTLILGMDGASYFIGSWFVIPGMVSILLALTKEDTGLIMDRLNGLISYPHAWWHLPIVSYFNEAVINISIQGRFQALKAIRPGIFTGYYTLESQRPTKYWCFMVWYMDKNRPLPPGTAFDPYRQKDFERRKAEGFPPPLYETNVPTDEATSEQQLEREVYWKETIVDHGRTVSYKIMVLKQD